MCSTAKWFGATSVDEFIGVSDYDNVDTATYISCGTVENGGAAATVIYLD